MEDLPADLGIHLYTVGDYAALGETEYWSELQEGKIVVSPSPTYNHGQAVSELFVQVRAQLPSNLIAFMDLDLDLALVPEDQPGTVRRPDLFVVDRADVKRANAEGRLLRASEVLLVVETVSPGSRRTDYRIKRDEYADAGIPNYWILDLDEPISLLACHLTKEFGYVDNGEATGTFTTAEPLPLTIDLTTLLD
ncbi:Uma2 family endonuclease [Kibdelosporangium aridum]|uniref:Uma2 family endonuclease n=1 Tax=Kibdelosporangium aridum TaxID=2030 RepID=A0A428Z1L1_KIBAR|nr:Uma2 family endonuclease [Kibdelosporangium aridum]RSM78726.1 Uma2 family endonuclease [Kibdelosporangium aridum]